jgi:hypothetical protein
MTENHSTFINQKIAKKATDHLDAISDPASFSGVVLMAKKGEILFRKAYGMAEFIPDYAFSNEMTIHHLLTHTSGTPNFTSFPEFKSKIEKNHIKPHQFIELLNTKDLDFKSGIDICILIRGIIYLD